jgi:hypothetical protein
MKDEKRDRPIGDCNCMNCRLERMEEAICTMNESVNFILDGRKEMPGMPKAVNRIKKN